MVERKDHLPQPASDALPNTAQDAVGGHLCREGAIAALCPACCPSGHQGRSLQSCFPTACTPNPSATCGYFSLGAGLCISLC